MYCPDMNTSDLWDLCRGGEKFAQEASRLPRGMSVGYSGRSLVSGPKGDDCPLRGWHWKEAEREFRV